ncbi:MAG: hypothetical protein P4L50_16325 [Anaerolineaceae bacterium]|nr:hypothetical protein [Anaerolineaceae bacterium]
MKITRPLFILFAICISLILLSASNMPPAQKDEQVRFYTRSIEFDYVNWTLNALYVKAAQTALDGPLYISDQQQHQTVEQYIALVGQIDNVQGQITQIYSDPNVSNPAAASSGQRQQLNKLLGLQQKLGPLAESIIQGQISTIISSKGLTLGGQPLPPVLYHITPLPLALIISPRNVIRQDTNVSLLPDLSIEQQVALENQIQKALNVSALVVPVGGVGVYPTMVESTTDIPWLLQTVAHEWTHNFLTLRPLGLSYDNSPELRTMNETTADISGTEIGTTLLNRYYPDLVPPPAPAPAANTQTEQPQQPSGPPPFDFNAEMHTTRVNTDQLLAAGKIKEAEAYMEARRRFLWDNGYQIRKLNQAYFAFYGAYADVPGGAAGTDPVGPAVRSLRRQSGSLSAFLNRISWMTSFAELQKTVNQAKGDGN